MCNQLAGGLGPFPRTGCFRKARQPCALGKGKKARVQRIEQSVNKDLARARERLAYYEA